MNAPDKLTRLAEMNRMVEALQAAERVKASRIYDAQPKIGNNGPCTLLLAEYDHEGILLDLYGEYHVLYGHEVTEISLAGSDICITDLFAPNKFHDFGFFCDRHLPNATDIKRIAKDDFEDNFHAH